MIQANDLSSFLSTRGRLMGLDVGTKTIGLSLSDQGQTIATALETIQRGKWREDVARMQTLITQHRVQGLAVGYPVNMDGSEGPRCQSVRAFCANLAKEFELPIALWDERMSTAAVTRTMLEADLSRARRAELVDKMAASYILQAALDRLRILRAETG